MWLLETETSWSVSHRTSRRPCVLGWAGSLRCLWMCIPSASGQAVDSWWVSGPRLDTLTLGARLLPGSFHGQFCLTRGACRP